jgi:hypothetical protein
VCEWTVALGRYLTPHVHLDQSLKNLLFIAMGENLRVVFYGLIIFGLVFQCLAFFNRTPVYKEHVGVFFFRPRSHFNTRGWLFRTISLGVSSIGVVLVFVSEFGPK